MLGDYLSYGQQQYQKDIVSESLDWFFNYAESFAKITPKTDLDFPHKNEDTNC